MAASEKLKAEAVVQRCSVKKVLLKISQTKGVSCEFFRNLDLKLDYKRLRHGWFFANFLKLIGTYFDALLEFSKGL